MSEQKQVKRAPQVKAAKPWDPTPWEDHHVFALQGLAAGTATPEQQKAALDWIIRGPCATYDLSYRPEGGTEFCEGRRFVGLQLVKLLSINPTILKRNK